MTRVPTIHITFEPSVSSKNKLTEQFWKCLNTRLDLGQNENYVSTSSNTMKRLTVKEGDIWEEEPHFFLFLPVSRPKDDFEYSFKRFTEQVSKIDNHVFLIILIKSGPDISDMEFFDRGFGAMKKIYLEDSCILDEGDTETTFNELADILKRKYNFKARDVRSERKSRRDVAGLNTLAGGHHEDQVKTYQASQRRQEEDVPEDPAQDQRNRPVKPEKSRILSTTIRKRGNWPRCLETQEREVTLDVETFESAKTLMEKNNFKFQRQFEKKFYIVPGKLTSIVKTMIDELEREGGENRMLTCDELENLRRKLNDIYRLQKDAFEELMLQIYKFHEKGKKVKKRTSSHRESSRLIY